LRISALEQLDRIGPQTDVVLELSSFQLEGLEVLETSPRAAVLTNLLVDHLNRYASLDEYFEAKRNIFRYQGADGILALNRDDVRSRRMAELAPGYVVWYGREDDVPGADRARLRGEHNRSNMAAAAAMAAALGVEREVIAHAIAVFPGVPYRQEFIREIDGVQFINDATATTPDATLAARIKSWTLVRLVARFGMPGIAYARYYCWRAARRTSWPPRSAKRPWRGSTIYGRRSRGRRSWLGAATWSCFRPGARPSGCSGTSSTAAISSTRSCGRCSYLRV